MAKKGQFQAVAQLPPQELQAALDKAFTPHTTLYPPLKNGVAELPGNQEQQKTAPHLIWVNTINDTWMEIPRFDNILWLGGWFLSLILLPPFIMVFFMFFEVETYEYYSMFLLVILAFFVLFSLIFLNLKMVLFSPRGCPVRINRARQKIYVYEFQKSWNPYKRWPTTIKIFDWVDIYAEISYESDRYQQGYRLHGAVCKPGTREVIERFIINGPVGHPKLLRGLWSHCCHYMNHQPVPTRPVMRERPRDWCPRNNIHWPSEVDIESTTAGDGIDNVG